ncbi:GTP-binding protein gtr1 [Mucor velutinosus]|uniref:GTP-binding protein gtr1 n=1 Tax=Mucor velutinosus TaxID=708070 RepID=A0AAN7DNV1_9FUNG|nr:GTP-binding protein gtr1 [Mucor velutinosus]
MKGQSRIEFHARKSRINHAETLKTKNIVHKQLTKAFRPVEHVVSKPQKVEKPVAVVRKSSRLASKDLKQTVLNLKCIEKPTTTTNEHHTKRKSQTVVSQPTIKKQKQHHDEEDKQVYTENTTVDTTNVPNDVVEKTVTVSKEAEIAKEEDTAEKTETITTTTEEAFAVISAKDVEVNETTEEAPLLDKDIEHGNEDPREQFSVEDDFTLTTKNTPTLHIPEEDALSAQDTLSPPSSCIEPMTPPRPSQQAYTAPHKEYLTETDKQRIEYETSTLEKLRKSLDIVITDRAARNRPTLYHQIESTLRMSTGRTISLSHICQIMYITPQLYTLEAKELRNYGGKVTEAFLIQFTKDWSMPLAGKDLQKRADILKSAITQYFKDHPEPDATIPEMTLPRLNLVIDKEEWLKKAPLPTGVRKLLEAHEKAKEAEVEREKPKPKPTGSVKDRMAALRARLAKKSA